MRYKAIASGLTQYEENKGGLAIVHGNEQSGIEATVKGSLVGVKVASVTNDPEAPDTFAIFLTHGSNGNGSMVEIGTVTLIDGEPTFLRSPERKI